MLREIYIIIRNVLVYLGVLGVALLIGLSAVQAGWGELGWIITALIFTIATSAFYKAIKNRNINDIHTAPHASHSPDLDHLIPAKGSSVKRRTAQELQENFKVGTHLFNGVRRIEVLGVKLHKLDRKARQIVAISFEGNTLSFEFNSGSRLEVRNPDKIYEVDTYTKILRADNIKFFWHANEDSKSMHSYVEYEVVGTSVNFNTNSELGRKFKQVHNIVPAVMMY
ncbi:MAG: hypothetical protein HWD92_02580 [Flavobacteriia bacterium]|nr:hypothetical protein [Flavobacteriia bacterium]